MAMGPRGVAVVTLAGLVGLATKKKGCLSVKGSLLKSEQYPGQCLFKFSRFFCRGPEES